MPTSLLAVGDSYLPTDLISPALAMLGEDARVDIITVDPDARPTLPGISESQGDPAQISAALDGHDVLLVHAAPVTAELLDAHPSVRLVACARGNPLNVDLAAAEARGVTVLNTPAKNADSVADLTMVFTHLLFRGAWPAANWLRDEAARGATTLDSTFAGGQWMAREPQGSTIGIVGLGAIGRRVANQAESYGMRVLAYDPFLTDDSRLSDLDTLLATSDIVTLHAKVTPESHHLISEDALARMRPGAFLINTARQALVDERALLDALESGHLAGAALDVVEPTGLWPELVRHPRVIITPHIGGATLQTQGRAMSMLVEDILRFRAGESVLRRAAGPGRLAHA